MSRDLCPNTESAAPFNAPDNVPKPKKASGKVSKGSIEAQLLESEDEVTPTIKRGHTVRSESPPLKTRKLTVETMTIEEIQGYLDQRARELKAAGRYLDQRAREMEATPVQKPRVPVNPAKVTAEVVNPVKSPALQPSAVLHPTMVVHIPKRPDGMTPAKNMITSGTKKIEDFEAAGIMTARDLQGIHLSLKVRFVSVHEDRANTKWLLKLEGCSETRTIRINVWGTPQAKPSDTMNRVPVVGTIGMIGPVSSISAEDPKYAKYATVGLNFNAADVLIQFVDDPSLQDKCLYAWDPICIPSRSPSMTAKSSYTAGAPGIPDPTAVTPQDFFD